MQKCHDRNKRTVRPVIWASVLLILVLSHALNAAQKGRWMKYPLPDGLPATWYRAVGENCLIFAGAEDSLIVAYDIHASSWYTHEVSTGLPWHASAAAGDDAAMVWNDSIVVAYSALTHEFVTLDYEGSLLGSDAGYGCSGYLAYFLTDMYFYVFDAEAAQWFQHSYNKPTQDIDAIWVHISGGKDDVLVELANRYGWIERSLIVFSHHTRTFSEINADNLVHERLDHGFVFWVVNDFFGGYSAFTGDFDKITIANIFYVTDTSPGAKLLHPRTTFTFFYRVEKEHPEYTGYICAYDTRHGFFQTAGFDHFILEEGLSTFDSWSGSEMGFQGVRNAGGDESVAYYVYNGQNHTFTYTGSPIYYCGFGRPHCCGGSVFTGYDYFTVMAYDARHQHLASAALPQRVEGFQAGISLAAGRDWTLADVKRVYSDTLFIYSYNGNTHAMTVRREYTTETSGSGYYARIVAENVCGFIIMDKFLLYAPGLDKWTEKPINRDKLIFGNQRDYIYYLDGDQLKLFNGSTGQDDITLPFGYDTYWYMDNYTYKQDNFFIAYNSDNQYVAYSVYTGTTSTYSSDFLAYRYGHEAVVVLGKGGSVDNLRHHVTYNALEDCWVSLIITAEEGHRSNISTGGKTALLIASNGFLFAFDPTQNAVKIDDRSRFELHEHVQFQLYQNFPNPFNYATKLRFYLPRSETVKIEIYNIRGQIIETLLNKPMRPGYHEVVFDGTLLSSGVYLYKLEAGAFLDMKKMVLLR